MRRGLVWLDRIKLFGIKLFGKEPVEEMKKFNCSFVIACFLTIFTNSKSVHIDDESTIKIDCSRAFRVCGAFEKIIASGRYRGPVEVILSNFRIAKPLQFFGCLGALQEAFTNTLSGF